MTCPRCAVSWPHLHVTDVLRRAGLLNIEWVNETALLRGTYVHQAIALGDRLDLASLDPAIAGYVRAWAAWKRDSGAAVVASEVPIAHQPLGYVGTLDALAVLNGRTYLVDYKSGGLPESVKPQTAAYRLALNAYGPKSEWTPVLHRAVLQLSADGSYRWRVLDDASDERTFRAALVCAQWQIAHGVN